MARRWPPRYADSSPRSEPHQWPCGPCFELDGDGEGDVDGCELGVEDGWLLGVGLGPGLFVGGGGGGTPLLMCRTMVVPCGADEPAPGDVDATVPAG